MDEPPLLDWVVVFGCPGDVEEMVHRQGTTRESVMFPDDLGCPAVDAFPTREFVLEGIWVKNGERRLQGYRVCSEDCNNQQPS